MCVDCNSAPGGEDTHGHRQPRREALLQVNFCILTLSTHPPIRLYCTSLSQFPSAPGAGTSYLLIIQNWQNLDPSKQKLSEVCNTGHIIGGRNGISTSPDTIIHHNSRSETIINFHKTIRCAYSVIITKLSSHCL